MLVEGYWHSLKAKSGRAALPEVGRLGDSGPLKSTLVALGIVCLAITPRTYPLPLCSWNVCGCNLACFHCSESYGVSS